MYRDAAADVEPGAEYHPNVKHLGGKQYQRALMYFAHLLHELLPNPQELRAHVATATGALRDGFKREDWDHACIEVIRSCMARYTHPGINVFIKHTAYIFHHLLEVALVDLSTGEQCSDDLRRLPPEVVAWIREEYDALLWAMVDKAAEKCHSQLYPLYTSVLSTLPTLELNDMLKAEARRAQEEAEKGQESDLMKMCRGLVAGSGSPGADRAKGAMRANMKTSVLREQEFLPSKRSAMVTSAEVDLILDRAFEYVLALSQFTGTVLEFSFNHHIFKAFKDSLDDSFGHKIVQSESLSALTPSGADAQARLEELRTKAGSLRTVLHEVTRMKAALTH